MQKKLSRVMNYGIPEPTLYTFLLIFFPCAFLIFLFHPPTLSMSIFFPVYDQKGFKTQNEYLGDNKSSFYPLSLICCITIISCSSYPKTLMYHGKRYSPTSPNILLKPVGHNTSHLFISNKMKITITWRKLTSNKI